MGCHHSVVIMQVRYVVGVWGAGCGGCGGVQAGASARCECAGAARAARA